MINVTVIKRKDAIKYLVRISIIMFLFFILSRYFSIFKNTSMTKKIGQNDTYNLISCIEQTIPQAKQIKNLQTEKSNKKDPIKMILKSELGIIDSLEKKQDPDVIKLSDTAESSISSDNLVNNLTNSDNNVANSVEIQKARNRCKNRGYRK